MSPGKIFVIRQDPKSVAGRLYNFVVGKADLRGEHQTWLTSNVVELLKAGGSVSLIGLASRTASDEVNMDLSHNRVESVVRFLRTSVPNNFKVAFHIALGEHAAQYAGVKDGVEDQNWRAVILSAWQLPDPPPPPPPPPPKPIITVERRVFASWMASYKINDRGATSGDGNASKFADGIMAVQHERRQKAGGYPVVEKKKQVPQTHKLTLIAVNRNTDGSNEYLVSGVEMNSCVVDFHWQKNYWSKGPILLDSYYRIGPMAGHPPDVMRLTESQANQWLIDPPKAKIEMQSWSMPRIAFEQYKKGEY